MRLNLVVATTAAVVLPTLPAVADSPKRSITVNIANLSHSNGTLRCALFSDQAGFPEDPARALARTTANPADEVCSFHDIKPGRYAITVHHDEDNDGTLDSNFFGVPTEGIGVSNNASSTFGPPKFADARFTVRNENIVLRIALQY